LAQNIKETTKGIIPFLLNHEKDFPQLDPVTAEEFDKFFKDVDLNFKPRVFYIWNGERLCLVEPEMES
jgi:hypothetical protein